MIFTDIQVITGAIIDAAAIRCRFGGSMGTTLAPLQILHAYRTQGEAVMTYIRSAASGLSDAAQSLYGKSSQSGIAGNSSATAALQTAEKRIQGEVDNTTTLLSSVGKLKSSVADAQSAAKSLSGFSTATTAEQMKHDIAQFVTAFNNTVAASGNVSTTGASNVSGAAGVGGDLKRAVNTDVTMADALRAWGVSVQSDGKLDFDTEKFDAQKTTGEDGSAVFQKLGQAIDKVATKELSSGGAVGRSLNSLNKRTDLLKAQQASLVKALQTDTATDKESDAKTSDAASALEAAKSQQNSLFDILQADSSDDTTDASTQASNAALQSYLSVLKQQ